jgi:hypothetical protein
MANSNELISPTELRKITADKDMEEAKKTMAARAKVEAEAKALYEAFTERQLHPEVKQRVSNAVRRAAEQGKSELLVLEFESEWCSDRGRAINNSEPDWPSTLTGFAKRAFEYFEKELKPLGYRVRAEVLTFPGGMPGKIGFFLAW